MKEALNFCSVINFTKLTLLDVNEFNQEVIVSSADQEYLRDIDIKTIEAMIDRYHYDGAKVFLESSKVKNSDLSRALEYANKRFNFDFDTTPPQNFPAYPATPREQIHELIQNVQISYYK